MAYILNIETSTTSCSVSISENGRLIGLKEDNSLEYSHAERLHVNIDELLKIIGSIQKTIRTKITN